MTIPPFWFICFWSIYMIPLTERPCPRLGRRSGRMAVRNLIRDICCPARMPPCSPGFARAASYSANAGLRPCELIRFGKFIGACTYDSAILALASSRDFILGRCGTLKPLFALTAGTAARVLGATSRRLSRPSRGVWMTLSTPNDWFGIKPALPARAPCLFMRIQQSCRQDLLLFVPFRPVFADHIAGAGERVAGIEDRRRAALAGRCWR